MSHDPYLRFLLTVIAIALAVIAGRDLISDAHATERMECRIEGPLELRDPVKIEVKQAYSQPGTSSSSPLYVKSIQ